MSQELDMSNLFNGNGLDPQTLKPKTWPRQEAYVKAVVETLKDEPGTDVHMLRSGSRGQLAEKRDR